MCRKVDQLPLAKFILENYPYSWVYGGFMRWLVTYYEENHDTPSIQDIHKILSQRDMDIRIRSNPDMEKFHPSSIMDDVYTKVRELSGRMEYAGDFYAGCLPSKSDKNRWRYGNYMVWIPNPDGTTYQRYDICIHSQAAHSIVTDFSVNNIQYNNALGITYDEHRDITEVLHDIRNSVMANSNYDFKKIYRGAKLWKQGYKIPDSDRYRMKEMINLYIDSDWVAFLIYEDDMSVPSVIGGDQDVIYSTKYIPTIVTKDVFLNNAFVKYLLS
jgi:hypothetical protein